MATPPIPIPWTQLRWPPWSVFKAQMEAEVETRPGETSTVVGRPTILFLPEVLLQDYERASAEMGVTMGEFLSYLTYIGARAVADDVRAAQFNTLTAPMDTETTVE